MIIDLFNKNFKLTTFLNKLNIKKYNLNNYFLIKMTILKAN